jgi:nucleobase:cation symporter-1, NCS1 family
MVSWRIRRPPEWGIDPVPPAMRSLRAFDLFVLWSSLGIGLLVLAAGALLVTGFGLTLEETFLVAILGSVIGSALLAAAAHHGSRAGVPTMVSLRPILGRGGSYLPSGLNVMQLLGWTAFEFVVMGEATALLLHNPLGSWSAAVFVPMWGGLTAVLALYGPLAVVRDWLERFAIWLVYASTAAIALALALHGLNPVLRPAPVAGNFTGAGSLFLSLDLVVAMPISWWPLISDYNRFARDAKASAVGTGLGYAVANTAFYVLGAALVIFGITAFGLDPSDPTGFLVAMGLLGLSVLPLIVILVDETDNAFADVYSAAVSVQNLVPKRRQLGTIIVATIVGIVVAWYLIGTGQGLNGLYEIFLFLIGGLFVPLLGVVIADSFVVRRFIRRESYRPQEFFEPVARVSWTAYAGWLPAAALYFGIVTLQIPVGATLPSLFFAMGLYTLLSYIETVRHSRVERAAVTDP